MGTAGDLTRWITPSTAATGASIMTRVNLTATAIATTAAPAGLAARTTWPTSWTLAPVQAPNCRSLSPSGPASSGSSTTAAVPNRVTIAIVAVMSSSSAPAVSLIAPMAEVPEIAKLVPMSRLRALPRPIRLPSQVVNTRVLTRPRATTPISGSPSAAMEANVAENPSSTMPACSSFWLNSRSCLVPVRGSTPMFPTSAPRQIAQLRIPSCGTRR